MRRREFDVAGYWDKRYKSGRHSGDGSRGEHAKRKAEIIAQLIQSRKLKRVYDLGCGDMYIMKLVRERVSDIEYTGVDLSPEIVRRNREQHPWGKFEVVKPGAPIVGTYDLIICYDVLFHLPKPAFDTTLKILRDADAPWVILSAWRKPMPNMVQHVFFNEFDPAVIGMVVGRDYLDDYRTSFMLLKGVKTNADNRPDERGIGNLSDGAFGQGASGSLNLSAEERESASLGSDEAS